MMKTSQWIVLGVVILQTVLSGCSKNRGRQQTDRSPVMEEIESKLERQQPDGPSLVETAVARVEIARCHELVKCTEVALVQTFDTLGCWPAALIRNNNTAKGLDATAAYPLRTVMNLKYDAEEKRLVGSDRFGIVTPWAAKAIKGRWDTCTESDSVPQGGTIADHRLRYALSLDGTGVIRDIPIREKVDGQWRDRRLTVRAMAAVWCLAPDGSLIKSWSDRQVK